MFNWFKNNPSPEVKEELSQPLEPQKIPKHTCRILERTYGDGSKRYYPEAWVGDIWMSLTVSTQMLHGQFDYMYYSEDKEKACSTINEYKVIQLKKTIISTKEVSCDCSTKRVINED
jgi:hypothetical protein